MLKAFLLKASFLLFLALGGTLRKRHLPYHVSKKIPVNSNIQKKGSLPLNINERLGPF